MPIICIPRREYKGPEYRKRRKEIAAMTNAERFKEIFTSQIDRPGAADLLTWLESTDFFTAPASTKYHGAFPGGLDRSGRYAPIEVKDEPPEVRFRLVQQ